MNRRRQEALERFERATELPLLILALAMVPLLLIPLLLDLSEAVETALVAADWFIWAAFAVEYVVRLSLSGSGDDSSANTGQTCSSSSCRSFVRCGRCAPPGRCDYSGWAAWPHFSARRRATGGGS